MTATAAMMHSASASATRSADRPSGQEFDMDQDFCGAFPRVAAATSEYSFVRLFDGQAVDDGNRPLATCHRPERFAGYDDTRYFDAAAKSSATCSQLTRWSTQALR